MGMSYPNNCVCFFVVSKYEYRITTLNNPLMFIATYQAGQDSV
jgi:hypothetical protein